MPSDTEKKRKLYNLALSWVRLPHLTSADSAVGLWALAQLFSYEVHQTMPLPRQLLGLAFVLWVYNLDKIPDLGNSQDYRYPFVKKLFPTIIATLIILTDVAVYLGYGWLHQEPKPLTLLAGTIPIMYYALGIHTQAAGLARILWVGIGCTVGIWAWVAPEPALSFETCTALAGIGSVVIQNLLVIYYRDRYQCGASTLQAMWLLALWSVWSMIGYAWIYSKLGMSLAGACVAYLLLVLLHHKIKDMIWYRLCAECILLLPLFLYTFG